MEYYAKSIDKQMPKDKVDKIIAGTSALINEYKGGDNSELVYALLTSDTADLTRCHHRLALLG